MGGICSFLTSAWNKITNGRSGFFLHEDGNEETNPGTAGCIGVEKEGKGIWKVRNSINDYQKAGNNEIEVRVDYDYEPPKEEDKKDDN